ncbi:hypothetical protein [Heyndrickxia acidicola]|uniref:Uncharacterized protein n=1 Tax=Heyndrickxia acidicola TaxID=209389 RepID=A0ABU6MMF2_9BACI|nr:hypothetical protein [Heyndrickxia acidicola]MED1205871.1 hypothetical protein [Heyndrickxia acidicola]
MNPFLVMAAKEKLAELEEKGKVYYSQWSQEEDEKLKNLFRALIEFLSSEQLKALISNIDDQTCYWSAAVGESQFIQGFEEGCKFAKQTGVNVLGSAI